MVELIGEKEEGKMFDWLPDGDNDYKDALMAVVDALLLVGLAVVLIAALGEIGGLN